MTRNANSLSAEFRIKFGETEEPVLVFSPGRVNIIGEHTDYNDGYVMPAAIDKRAYVAASKREDGQISLYSAAFNQRHQVALEDVAPSEKRWPDYVLGVVDQLQKNGKPVSGFNLLLDGDIPLGAGLSSSAAVECAVLFALNELFDLSLTRMEMARLAQRSEHEFVGVKCGIMDMFASLFGKPGHALFLDCRNLEYEYVPLDLTGHKLLLLNTNVKHSLTSSAYNTRRSQCEQGVKWIQEHVPGVQALRDATPAMLDEWVLPNDEEVYRRCRYVVEENNRLLEACANLKEGNIPALGKKMFATHEGLSKLYEVSCPELDFLVDFVKDKPYVLGARMMGGGFGGCTINIVKESAIEELVTEIKPAYEEANGLTLDYYVASIEEGTHQLKQTARI